MVYGGEGPTALLSGRARRRCHVALTVLGMLVGQGATAIDIWNQEREGKTPREVMRSAAEAELARRVSGGGRPMTAATSMRLGRMLVGSRSHQRGAAD